MISNNLPRDNRERQYLYLQKDTDMQSFTKCKLNNNISHICVANIVYVVVVQNMRLLFNFNNSRCVYMLKLSQLLPQRCASLLSFYSITQHLCVNYAHALQLTNFAHTMLSVEHDNGITPFIKRKVTVKHCFSVEQTKST